MVGSRPEGGCTMTLHDVVHEHFFDSGLVVPSGSVSDDFDNVVEVIKKIKNKSPQQTQNTLERQDVSEQSPNQVEDIESSTTSTLFRRTLFQNSCPNRYLNRLRNLR